MKFAGGWIVLIIIDKGHDILQEKKFKLTFEKCIWKSLKKEMLEKNYGGH
jgi:hypothetical protein